MYQDQVVIPICTWPSKYGPRASRIQIAEAVLDTCCSARRRRVSKLGNGKRCGANKETQRGGLAQGPATTEDNGVMLRGGCWSCMVLDDSGWSVAIGWSDLQQAVRETTLGPVHTRHSQPQLDVVANTLLPEKHLATFSPSKHSITDSSTHCSTTPKGATLGITPSSQLSLRGHHVCGSLILIIALSP
jgi:hypothetical protein